VTIALTCPSGHDGVVDFEAAADRLYGLAPRDFVAARNDLVRSARESRNPDLAARISRLRRPTVGAWLTNLLAREHTEQVEQLIELGAMLREAQDSLDGSQLQALGRERRQVVAALAGLARRRAAELGHPVGDTAMREVEGTLTAALADPEAGRQVLGARLTAGLEYAGLGFGETAGTAGPRLASAPATRPGKTRLKAVQGSRDDDSEALLDEAERELVQARLQAAQAREGQRAADSEKTKAERAVRATVDGQRRLESQLAALQQQLLDGEELSRHAQALLGDAERASEAAGTTKRSADALVVDAQLALDKLREDAAHRPQGG
jgi:hypothetical protein